MNRPLTDPEARIFHQITYGGTGAYPIRKLGPSDWVVCIAISTSHFLSQRAASEFIETWADDVAKRWSEMKIATPGITLDETGIHLPSRA